MDMKRRRELLDEWKNRHPEMGVIIFKCKATGEEFIGISKDTRADYNSNHFKLGAGGHPNKRMQEIWNQYGDTAFDFAVLKTLEYEDMEEDHTAKLEKLLSECLENVVQARRIWR